jgi:hypothetical protein
MQARSNRDELLKESKAGAHGWPLPGTCLTRVQISQIQAILIDRHAHSRSRHNGQAPPRRARGGSWNSMPGGTRKRLLKERKKAGAEDYLKLLDYQALIVQLCSALEAFQPEGYDFSGAVGMWYAPDLLDDLISPGHLAGPGHPRDPALALRCRDPREDRGAQQCGRPHARGDRGVQAAGQEAAAPAPVCADRLAAPEPGSHAIGCRAPGIPS